MTLSETINRMITIALESSTWTSAGGANPVENFIKEVRGLENPDLEEEIRGLMGVQPGVDAGADPANIGLSPDLSNISEQDAKGILNKAGINPADLTGMLQMTSGRGIGGLLTGGAARAILGPAAIALMIQPIMEGVIKELQRPGGFLDKRVKIDARNEAFAEIDRQTRQNTRIGDRQVIIQQFQGFGNRDGFGSTNTSRLIQKNANRVLDIGLFDRAHGVE